jgi:hypothetical protein
MEGLPMKLKRTILSATVCLSVSGCATNAIELDRAATMSDAGRVAGAATLDMANRSVKANRDTIIEIVTYDPNCKIPRPEITLSDKPGIKLCDPDDQSDSISFARQTRKDLLPTLAVIEGITSYLDAVDEILAREPIDLVGSLTNAKSDLEAISTITGGGGKPLLSDEQTAAVTSVSQLVQVLLSEAEKGGDLRELEKNRQKDGASVEASVKALKTLNTQWFTGLQGYLKTQKTLATTSFEKAPPSDLDRRRAAIARLYDIHDQIESAPELKAKVDELADTFAQAHKEYLELLPAGSKAKLTPAEKRKHAELIKQRVRAALHSLASLVSAF